MSRRWWWAAGIAVLLVAVACTVWWATSRTDTVNDFGTPEHPPADVAVVQRGSDWTLEWSAGAECFQLRLGSEASQCMSTLLGEGSSSLQTLQSGERRFIVLALDSGADDVGLRFLSSAHPDGSDVELTTVAGTVRLTAIEVGRGEHPWGLQVVTADNTLWAAISLLDS